MAIEINDVLTNLGQDRQQGLSTDAKPATAKSGSRFYELDTGKYWIYSEANVNPATGTHWWEV